MIIFTKSKQKLFLEREVTVGGVRTLCEDYKPLQSSPELWNWLTKTVATLLSTLVQGLHLSQQNKRVPTEFVCCYWPTRECEVVETRTTGFAALLSFFIVASCSKPTFVSILGRLPFSIFRHFIYFLELEFGEVGVYNLIPSSKQKVSPAACKMWSLSGSYSTK